MTHSRIPAVSLFATLVFLSALSSLPLYSQQATVANTAVVPTLVQFSGVLTDVNGKPLSGLRGVTFYLYKDQQGGAPLWMETQNVQPDRTGRYSVTLGSASSHGLPAELFASGEPRWLGVQVQGQEEQPRVMLLSVPYAMKAGDAQTVGGLPPSAFVLAAPPTANAARAMAGSKAASVSPDTTSDVTTTGGTVNTIPLFTTATNIQNSILTQTGTTAIYVGGNLSLPALGAFEIGNRLFGFGSLSKFNAFLGFAGNTTTTGIGNTASGFEALYDNTTGGNNTASGFGALHSNTTASYNTASGFQALYSNTTGVNNTADGWQALYYNMGNYNTAVGTSALTFNSSGTDNTAIGDVALYFNSTGNYNTASGYQALYSNTTGGYNTASGVYALADNTTGSYNTASGDAALSANTTGNDNTASGYAALHLNTTASNNTASGYQALYSNTMGGFNTASGSYALFSNTTGGDNTAMGADALYSNTSGGYNTATGFTALVSNTSGGGNTASGYEALYSNTSGFSNTATGYQALQDNSMGYDNTATGYQALQANTGDYNTASGFAALLSNNMGYSNTAEGAEALLSNTSGYNNTAVGAGALSSNTTGSNLTCIGASCTASDGITNATAIGAHAVVEQSNSLVLGGTGNHAVSVGIGTTKPSSILTVGRGAGHPVSDSWETYSSRRWKTNIHPLQNALRKVEQLRGVSYDLKDSGKHEIGVIAEEVGAVVPEVVSYEKNGKDATGVDYSRLTALLIEAVKEQQGLIQKQQKQIRTQQVHVKAQDAQIAELMSQVKAIQVSLKTSGRTGPEVRTVKARVPVEQ